MAEVPDPEQALRTLTELLARLVAVAAPAELRRLDELTLELLDQAPRAVRQLRDPAHRRLIRACAAGIAELLPVRAHRLLHWDLHYRNVLAGVREPWLAIDPKPLAGEPGFELLPVLRNRWTELAAGGCPARAVRRRFDLMTEVLELDRHRAAVWTGARVLQQAIWDTDAGATTVDPIQWAIADALRART